MVAKKEMRIENYAELFPDGDGKPVKMVEVLFNRKNKASIALTSGPDKRTLIVPRQINADKIGGSGWKRYPNLVVKSLPNGATEVTALVNNGRVWKVKKTELSAWPSDLIDRAEKAGLIVKR